MEPKFSPSCQYFRKPTANCMSIAVFMCAPGKSAAACGIWAHNVLSCVAAAAGGANL